MITPEELVKEAETYKAQLISVVCGITHDVHAAQDIVQDTYVKLLKQDTDKIRDRLGAWLTTVCRNAALKHIRRRQKCVYVADMSNDVLTKKPQPTTAFSPIEEMISREIAKEDLAQLAEAMNKLNPCHRQALYLVYFAEMTYADAAKEMNITIGNVGFMVSTAIKNLRKKVKKSHG